MQHGAGLVERPLAATSLGDCMLQLLQQVAVASGGRKCNMQSGKASGSHSATFALRQAARHFVIKQLNTF